MTPSLGKLIRSLRTRHGWTLLEMSQKTGIPPSTLSKVEHDRLTLGYNKLQQISQRLAMRMSDLFADDDEGPESRALTRRSIGSIANAMHDDSRNYERFFLCPDLRKKRMAPWVVRVRAGTLEEFGELVRHGGEEFFYVMFGRIVVHTEFYEPVTLEAGQCVYLDSGMGHAYLLAPGCGEASAVGCCSADESVLDSLAQPVFYDQGDVRREAVELVAKQPKKSAPRPKACPR
jgi:transcriptional regulator with XRE-family HTH domain